jgi:hypothetical protein
MSNKRVSQVVLIILVAFIALGSLPIYASMSNFGADVEWEGSTQ